MKYPEIIKLIDAYATRKEVYASLKDLYGYTSNQSRWFLHEAKIQFPEWLSGDKEA